MAVYNSAPFLEDAVRSILNQTFSDFEFLIINDASTDDSVTIIEAFADPRIRLIHNAQNIGLTRSLNKGLKLAQGKYIARMDADDISLPERLEKQVTFMEHHPEVGVCGAWFNFIDAPHVIIKRPPDQKAIKINFLKTSPIGHPTALIRKSVLDEFDISYDENFRTSQDYDLWERISHVSHLANIQEVLVNYRRHNEQVTKLQHKQQQNNAAEVRKRLLKKIVPTISEEERLLYEDIISNHFNPQNNAASGLLLLKKLIEGNKRFHIYEQKDFVHFFSPYIQRILNNTHKFQILIIYFSIPDRKCLSLKLRYIIKFLIKCVLHK